MLIVPKEYVISNNRSIDSILNYMIQKAKEKGIDVKQKTLIIEEIDLDYFLINVILGNLLSNAIEAAEEAERKYKGQFLSSKNDKVGHGYGLQNVYNIIEKHKGEISIRYTRNVFFVSVLLYVDACDAVLE